MADIFQKTLIVGASVSAATADRNPVKRFLRKRGELTDSVTHAYDGRTAAYVLSTLKKSILKQATAIVSVDLLFWDSVMGLGDPKDSLAFFRGFMNEVKSRELPLILGRIPGFHPLQIHREELNEAIEKECRNYPHGRVLQLDRLFEQVMKDDGVLIDGKHHRMQDLIPDGLHPGPVAAEYIAQEIARVADDLKQAVVIAKGPSPGDASASGL